MIKNTKQCWEIGEVVKIGFLSLRIIAKEPTPGDYKPDAYILCGLGKNEKNKYRFVPHNGLEKIAEAEKFKSDIYSSKLFY